MENFDSLFILDFFPLISILKNLINIRFTLITEVFGDSLNFVWDESLAPPWPQNWLLFF